MKHGYGHWHMDTANNLRKSHNKQKGHRKTQTLSRNTIDYNTQLNKVEVFAVIDTKETKGS